MPKTASAEDPHQPTSAEEQAGSIAIVDEKPNAASYDGGALCAPEMAAGMQSWIQQVAQGCFASVYIALQGNAVAGRELR